MNHGWSLYTINGINLKIIDAMEMNKKFAVVTIINYTNFVGKMQNIEGIVEQCTDRCGNKKKYNITHYMSYIQWDRNQNHSPFIFV